MIRPRDKRILVEPIDEEKHSGRIQVIIFDKYNVKSSGIESKTKTRGKVIALGPNCDHENGAKVGDIVRFTHHGGLPFHHENMEYLLLSEKDLIGVEE